MSRPLSPGKVTGDVSIFDRPGPVTIRVERAP